MVSVTAKRLFCPRCGWSNVRLSERAGFLDGAAALLLLTPLRCRTCRIRFYRLWFLARRAPLAGTLHYSTSPPAAVPRPGPNPVPVLAVRRSIILLLDDDPALRKLLRRLLDREGYEVREAADPVAAAVALGEAEIDLAIVNLSAHEEGEEVVRGLRLVYPELPVIALSETPGLAETSEKLLILPKPSRAFAVVEGVRELMSRDRQLGNYDYASRPVA
jgi:CheY-like chemotaxis protein